MRRITRHRRNSTRRLHVPDLESQAGEIRLGAEESHYLRNVLRLSCGDELLLFDGSGLEYPAVVSGTSGGGVRLALRDPRKGLAESPVRVILCVGLLKAQKMDLVVQKSVELGVHEIVPLATERAVRALDAAAAESRRGRWAKIAREASRQCGRCAIPEIRPVASLGDAVSGFEPTDLCILFSTRQGGSLETIRAVHGAPKRIFALTGPEGGLTPDEEERLLAAGFLPVTLGPRTLRAETAAVLAVGLLQHRFGDLR